MYSFIFRSKLLLLLLLVSLNLGFGQSPNVHLANSGSTISRPPSSSISILAPKATSGPTTGTPQLNTITTSPNPPVTGQAFRFTITGSGFEPNSAMVVFNGPGCPASTCSFTSGSITGTSTQLAGIAMLSVGSFTVTVTNGSSGTPSNGLTLSVFGSSTGAPQLSTITTSPSPPASGQAFTFTVTGSGFDSSSTTVLFNGPGCTNASCSFAIGSLSGTATQLNGTAILGGGDFTVMVKNGSNGALSNSLTLKVSGTVIGTPQISAITTSPDPVSAQPFVFTITGSFDPSSAIVIFNGPGCTVSVPCIIANSAMLGKDTAHLSGTVTLVDGTFTVTVQNGSNGTPSNALTLTVSGPSGTPQVRTLITSPSPPVNAQAFTFSITGTDFDPNSAAVVFDGPGCGLDSSTCIIPTNALLAKSAFELDGVAILTGGHFNVTVQNTSSGATSNTFALTVSGAPGAPQLSYILTTPDPPLSGQAFAFSIAGTGFDPNTAMVTFSGPGCTNSMPCIIANGALSGASPTQLNGTVTLAGGSFTVTVQNGLSGPASDGLTLAVSGTIVQPQLDAITTTPDPPNDSQAFTFSIIGSGFDANNAMVFFNGPGCNASTTCSIANNALLNKSSTELDGVAILTAGSFNVTVLNGPVSGISNSQVLVVAATGVIFQLSGINTSPSPPVDGQSFAFTVSGTGFNTNNAVVVFSGPGCTPCTIANAALSSATSTTLSGTTTLAAGTYTVVVQNGSGTPSNGVSLTVSSSTAGAIQLTGLTTTPNPPVGGQVFTFSITGTGLDPSSVLVSFSGPGCAPCTIANSALSSTSLTGLSGGANLPAGNFTVTVQNGNAGTPSNGLSLTVSSPTGPAPQTTALTTTPDQPVDGQAFTFVITGTGFDPNGALVIFTGPNCTPCSIANSALTGATTTQLSGTATLGAGNYTVTVQNGSSGAPSNGQQLMVAVPAGSVPQISQVTTSPSALVNAQPFTFTIIGSGFDPASAVVFFTGPNCNPCSVTNANLTVATSTELDGTAALVTGSYIVTVQNGNGPSSNGQPLAVASPTSTGLRLDSIFTSPSPLVHGQTVIIILFGAGFDPNSATVVLNGPSCTPCTIPNSDILVNPSGTAIGAEPTIPAAGNFVVTVLNGSGGPASNGLTVSVQ